MKNSIKRTISLLICLMLLVGAFSSTSLAASKTSGKCGKHATWSYNKKKKTLTISGKGEIKDKWSSSLDYKRVNVVIKEGITAIGKDAFSETCIKKLSLPKSLTTIGANAFGGMEAETPSTITIPKNVKKIGKHAFSFCDGTKKYKVEAGNKYFTAKDGVLFNKEKTVLISFPSRKGGAYTIPDGVKTISYGAFTSCNLEKLTVPASVKTIKEEAFVWAGIKNLWFKGRVPSGLADELNEDNESEIKKVHFPREYYNEWYLLDVDNDAIKWYSSNDTGKKPVFTDDFCVGESPIAIKKLQGTYEGTYKGHNSYCVLDLYSGFAGSIGVFAISSESGDFLDGDVFEYDTNIYEVITSDGDVMFIGAQIDSSKECLSVQMNGKTLGYFTLVNREVGG